MRIRIVEGQDAPWSGEVLVTPFVIIIDSREYCPLDDLHGVVVEELDDEEQEFLAEAGFELNLLH